MDYFAGLDVSVKETSVCIVDDAGKIVREARVASEPEALLQVLANNTYRFKRVGLEAGPLSQWLYSVDRKSTRLNSSHANISYAVFCLKKKKSHIHGVAVYRVERDVSHPVIHLLVVVEVPLAFTPRPYGEDREGCQVNGHVLEPPQHCR